MIDPTGHEVHWNPHELEEDLELEELPEQEEADEMDQEEPEYNPEDSWDEEEEEEESFRIAEEMDWYLDDESF